MSRSESISRRADGISSSRSWRIRSAIELRGGSRPARGAVRRERALAAARVAGSADQRAEVEQGVVELRVGPARAGQPMEIEAQLPATGVVAAVQAADDPGRVGVDQYGAAAEPEAETAWAT